MDRNIQSNKWNIFEMEFFSNNFPRERERKRERGKRKVLLKL